MIRRALVVLGLALAVGGCEDSVDPTVGLDVPFSLYGQLDPTSDRQAIRVAPIGLSITAADSLTIDAAVTSTDLGTGAVTAWRDSLVTFADGQTGHVFVADVTPAPGSTVRIEARRSDGATSTVDVEVPPIVAPRVGGALFIENGVGYAIAIDGAPTVLNGTFTVTVAGHPDDAPGVARRLTIPIFAQPVEVGTDAWAVEVPFVTATRRSLTENGLRGLGFVSAEYTAFVASRGWRPPSTDPDALVEPGAFSNVEDGLGFVGAGYAASVRWLPSTEAIAAAGFVVGDDPAAALTLNEIYPGTDAWVELYNPTLGDISLRGYSLSDDPANRRRQPLINEVVPAGGFLVVPLDFPLVNPTGRVEIGLYGRSQELVAGDRPLRIAIDDGGTTVASYGSYPDGESFVVRRQIGLEERQFDLFRGALAPTPGQPNRIGLDLATVNEAFTEGAGGWVESFRQSGGVDSLSVLARGDTPGGRWQDASPVVAAGGAFGVADENATTLVLAQNGGEVFLLGRYVDPRVVPDPRNLPDGAPYPPQFDARLQIRVLDARAIGPQSPGRTSGRLPDATGPWRSGLRPTRGAPNAAARFGL